MYWSSREQNGWLSLHDESKQVQERDGARFVYEAQGGKDGMDVVFSLYI